LSEWSKAFDRYKKEVSEVEDALEKVKRDFDWTNETILLKAMRNEFETKWSQVLNVDQSPLSVTALTKRIIK